MIPPSPLLLELAEEKKRSRSAQDLIPIHRQRVSMYVNAVFQK